MKLVDNDEDKLEEEKDNEVLDIIGMRTQVLAQSYFGDENEEFTPGNEISDNDCRFYIDALQPTMRSMSQAELSDALNAKPLIIDNSINLMDKSEIGKLKFNIKNLIGVVSKAIYQMDSILQQLQREENTLILAIGSTGCGKSTMFTSLIEGPKSLAVTEIDIERNIS